MISHIFNVESEAVEMLIYQMRNEIKDLQLANETLTIQARDLDTRYKLNNIKIKLLNDYLNTYIPPVNNATKPKHLPP